MTDHQPNLLKSKPHFHALDGLRGIAAIAVVVFHFMEWIQPDINKNFIGYGFLAVDFFFCLSGFVIAYAYDQRLPKMGLKSFFTARLIRLHPLVVIGTVLGLIGLFLDPFSNHAESLTSSKLVLIIAASLFMIPYPTMEARSFNLFSLNAPGWSLFWEYVANIMYATIIIRLSKKILVALLLLSAVGILYISNTCGHLVGGWNSETFLHGGIRMSYSFLAGMLIFRFGYILKNKMSFVLLSLLLLLAFMTPNFAKTWLTEALIVLLYFPIIIMIGAGSILNNTTEKCAKFLGDISYPLYMTHYAGIWIFGNYISTHKVSNETLYGIVTLGSISLIVISWIVMKTLDFPIRTFLNKLRSKKIK